jgi:hypothetical protein
MRTHAILATLLTLSAGVSAGGCQILAGLTVIDIAEGQGGAGGAGSTVSTASSSGSSTSTGSCCGQMGCTLPCPNNHCSSNEDCPAHNLCLTMMSMCVACGISPQMPPLCAQDGKLCESCDKSTCIKTCDTPGECGDSYMMLEAPMRPVRLVCNDQCNDTTISCTGPNPCEIVCNDNGCKNLIMNCAGDGPCVLTCTGTGCASVQMNCGVNECTEDCVHAPSAHVVQKAGPSCAAINTNHACQ